MGNVTKNQHYIAESLLRHFTNGNGRLFELLVNKKSIYPTNIGSAMCMHYTYEHEKLTVNTIENYFARIEAEVSPEIIDLIKDIRKYKNNEINFDIIKKRIEKLLPIFIIFYYRSGALLEEFGNIRKEDKIPLLSNKILNERYISELSLMIKDEYNFAIVESVGGFIMSDQYVSTASLKIKGNFSNLSNRTIGIKETIILIPISSKFYAVYWHSDSSFFIKENSINLLTEEKTIEINRVIVNNAYIKCIGECEEYLKSVMDDFYFGSPTSLYAANDETGYFAGAITKKEVFFYDIDRLAYRKFLEFHDSGEYGCLKVNDTCLCGSGKKFKKCHKDMYARVKPAINDLKYRPDRSSNRFVISRYNTVEQPIDSWSGYKK